MSFARTQPPLAARIGALILLGVLSACGPTSPDARLDQLATRYVKQAMHLDRLRPGEVDAFFGPQRLDTRGEPAESTLEEIRENLNELLLALSHARSERGLRLRRRVAELEAVVAFLSGGERLSFPEEARRLFGVDWVEPETLGMEAARSNLEAALPGRGSLRARMVALRRQLTIPAERRQAVFEAALEACRQRTLEHWKLPGEERITLEWTRDVDAAWHRYEGDSHSTLSINPLAMATVDQSLEIACHEGYPGHHAQFVLFEMAAGEEGLALEDKLVLLRTPASALREGAAMAAVELVFPESERLAFERDILFPLAGLNPQLAERYAALRADLEQLALAVPAIIRDHEDLQLSDADAINRLQSEALVASPRALFAYAHQFGAYIAGYTLVDVAMATRLGGLSPAAAWEQLRRYLEQPERWGEAVTDL